MVVMVKSEILSGFIWILNLEGCKPGSNENTTVFPRNIESKLEQGISNGYTAFKLCS